MLVSLTLVRSSRCLPACRISSVGRRRTAAAATDRPQTVAVCHRGRTAPSGDKASAIVRHAVPSVGRHDSCRREGVVGDTNPADAVLSRPLCPSVPRPLRVPLPRSRIMANAVYITFRLETTVYGRVARILISTKSPAVNSSVE